MKKEQNKLLRKVGFILSIFLLVLGGFCIKSMINSKNGKLFENSNSNVSFAPFKSTVVLEYLQKEAENKAVYDGLTLDELIAKLNRSLKGKVSGRGNTFATKALELGIDPYLAVAIVLHETGCNGTCSRLVENCNNVGGMKGRPGCNGGSYRAFATLDEGIDAFLNNLYNNYIAKGLVTPEQIGAKYAASPTWPSKIHYYMNKIKEG